MGGKKTPLEATIQILFGVESLLLAPHDDDDAAADVHLYIRVSRDSKVLRNYG